MSQLWIIDEILKPCLESHPLCMATAPGLLHLSCPSICHPFHLKQLLSLWFIVQGWIRDAKGQEPTSRLWGWAPIYIGQAKMIRVVLYAAACVQVRVAISACLWCIFESHWYAQIGVHLCGDKNVLCELLSVSHLASLKHFQFICSFLPMQSSTKTARDWNGGPKCSEDVCQVPAFSYWE